MDAVLRAALADRAASVEAPATAWEVNSRRVRRDARMRTAVASLAVVVVATTGVLGFRFVHEPGRGQPVPVQPAASEQPAPP